MNQMILVGLLTIINILALGLMVFYLLANRLKALQKFYCKIGWHCHSMGYQFEYDNGKVSDHCTCKWCGYKSMIDSQGNIF